MLIFPNNPGKSRYETRLRCKPRRVNSLCELLVLLWTDDRGYVISMEMLLWGSIMALSTVLGMFLVRDGVRLVFC